MRQYITLFMTFIALNVGLQNSTNHLQLIKQHKAIEENPSLTVTDSLYNINIEIIKTPTDDYNLVISVDLKNDSYYVSPNTKKEYKGKFYMDFGSYKAVSFSGKLQENKLEKSDIDPYQKVDDPENWVFGNAVFTQKLNLKTTEDFFVMGRIKFVIEPRCTMENIPFMISFKNGKMNITEAKC